jgi:hypothetical protein
MPPHHDVTRGGVAEMVEPEAGDAGPRERRLERGPDLAPPPIVTLREHAALAALRVRLERNEDLVHGSVDGAAPRLIALRAVEADPRAREVDPFPFEAEQLALPHAGMEGKHHDAVQVTVPRGTPGLEEPADLVRVQEPQTTRGVFGRKISGTTSR